MKTIYSALAALFLTTPLLAQVRPGEAAPDFTLTSVDGERIDLAAARDQVVVLEWTSHLCPAVARVHESGIMADTRAAVASDGVVWLQIDSSWFGPNLAGDIQAWRTRLGLQESYLLDPDGRVARAYGAQATPHVFVIAGDGTLAYSGLVHDDAPESARRNYVVETVRALLEGQEIETEQTQAVGCTVKLGTPRATALPAEIDEDHVAGKIYLKAVKAARQDKFRDAVELFARAIEEGLPRPWRIVADDDFAALMSQAEPRLEIRSLLSEPARGNLVMVPVSEPGEGLVIAGTVSDEDGEPIPGAVVALYHTDAAGYYSPGSTSGQNARLFGRVATDRAGRFRIRTIMPAYYADSDDGLQHIHMGTRATGFLPKEGHRASLYFEDDPNLKGAYLEEIQSDGCAIRPVGENAEGVRLVVHDIVLKRE